MTMFDQYFGPRSAGDQDYTVPSGQTAKEFGKVDVRRSPAEVKVRFTILMPPENKEAEGWQTGVALDASASMKGWFGRELTGGVPPHLIDEYERKGWVTTRTEDGRRVRVFQREAYEDAISKTAAPHAPWIVVPANAKWYRNLVVAQAVVEALRLRRKGWKRKLDRMGSERRAALTAFRAERKKPA